MPWIPELKFGIVNGWLFMVIYPLQWAAVLVLPARIAERTSHAPGIMRTRMDRIMGFFTNALWIGATLFSVVIPLRVGTPWFWAGLALFITGLAVLVLATITVSATPSNAPFSTGMYRFSRHPMYLSMILVYLGVSTAAASWPFLLVTAATFMLQRNQVMNEEAWCLERFGQAYRDYMAVTRRWIGWNGSRARNAPR